ncbi:MAG: TRAP-type C4-dicarboxylate transport system substrate-binding protein [Bradymonadia bacterium]|jgi:TRAP-type C4-dicarboxylate transport system substrate-binding protein
MKRFVSLLVALLTLPLASSASAQTRTCTVESPCVVRMSTVAPRGTPWADQLNRLKDFFEEESGGRLDVRAYLGSSDGEVSLARQCKDGALEGVGVSTGAIASLVPELGVFELPFLFDTATQADSVIDDHLFGPVQDLLRSNDNGFELYFFSENGFRNFATANGTPIRTAADLETVQMRSQESWIHEEMYRALGGNPVSIPVTEVSAALSSRNVQGFDNTPLYAQAAGWQEFVNTWSVSNHIYQPAVIVWNAEFYNSMPADLQELLVSRRSEETARGRRAIRDITPLLIQNFGAFGVEVYTMTAAERSAMAVATAGIYDMFRERVPNGAGLLDAILANR